MPFSIGFGELVVIGIVALIVIGPKDLPQMFRTVGRFTGRMRAMADDFRRTLESAADDVGVNDIRKDFNHFSDYAKSNSGVDEANNTIRDFNKMRTDSIHEDASELEADLAEEEIVSRETEAAEKVKTTEVNTSEAKTSKAKTAQAKKSAPKTASAKKYNPKEKTASTATAKKTAKKPATKKSGSKDKQ